MRPLEQEGYGQQLLESTGSKNLLCQSGHDVKDQPIHLLQAWKLEGENGRCSNASWKTKSGSKRIAEDGGGDVVN